MKLHVEGTGFSGAAPGLYIGLTEAGPVDPTNAGAYLGTVWLQDSKIVDGKFSVDLEPIALTDLDPEKSYEVHTQRAHGMSAQDPSQNVRQAVDIFADDAGDDDGDDTGEQPGNGDDTGEQPGDGDDTGEQPSDGDDTGEQPSDGGEDSADDAGEQPAGEGSGEETGGEGTPKVPGVVQTDGVSQDSTDPAALALGEGLLATGLGLGAVVVIRRRQGESA